MNGCDILLYGTMADIGPAVRDDLAGHGLEVELVEFAQNTPRDFFGYSRGLFKAVERLRPRAVMPVGDSLAMARIVRDRTTSAGWSEAMEGTRFIVAAADAVELLNSKVRTYELAEKLGIREPRRFSYEEIARCEEIRQGSEVKKSEGICCEEMRQGSEVKKSEGISCEEIKQKSREDIGVIFKRDTSFGGSGVHRPRTIGSLKHLIEHENGTPYLIEEYIDGEDLSVDCVRMRDNSAVHGIAADNGEAAFFRAGAYVSTGRVYTQGPAVDRCKTECPEAVEAARKILEHLDYQGVCGLDFRRTADGGIYLLECNPRFTGGIRTQIQSGFDIPWLLLKMTDNAF